MTSISNILYIDKLNDTVNKYNNTYHRAIEMKPVKRKILNLKLVTMYKYQIIKTFLKKVSLKNWSKELLWLKNLQILCRGYMLLVILTVKKL